MSTNNTTNAKYLKQMNRDETIKILKELVIDVQSNPLYKEKRLDKFANRLEQQPEVSELKYFIETKENDATHVVHEYGTNKSVGVKRLSHHPPSTPQVSPQISEERIEEVISEVEAMHPYKKPGVGESYYEYAEGWSDACDVLGEKIKELTKPEK